MLKFSKHTAVLKTVRKNSVQNRSRSFTLTCKSAEINFCHAASNDELILVALMVLLIVLVMLVVFPVGNLILELRKKLHLEGLIDVGCKF